MQRQAPRKSTVVRAEMVAAVIDRFGPPSVLHRAVVPVPEPGPREVLIALHAAGVGSWDESMRDGSWKEGRVRFPRVIGTDGAGVVVAKGTRVKRFRVGDRVYSASVDTPQGGFYAQYVAVSDAYVAPAPRRLDFAQAAAVAFPGLTAMQGVNDVLAVRRGETVVIFGASGAVGTMAVQFAKKRGARVIATASGRAAQSAVRRLGASATVDARDPKMVDELLKLAPDGIDAVLAFAGGEELERCVALVRSGGRVAYPNGVEPEPHKRRGVRARSYDADNSVRAFARLTRSIDANRLQVPIAATFPLARAADAHRRQREHVIGRIVLRIRRGEANPH
jgi:NADPH:quinone reductase-like Zn-dependent oxidoreductase